MILFASVKTFPQGWNSSCSGFHKQQSEAESLGSKRCYQNGSIGDKALPPSKPRLDRLRLFAAPRSSSMSVSVGANEEDCLTGSVALH